MTVYWRPWKQNTDPLLSCITSTNSDPMVMIFNRIRICKNIILKTSFTQSIVSFYHFRCFASLYRNYGKHLHVCIRSIRWTHYWTLSNKSANAWFWCIHQIAFVWILLKIFFEGKWLSFLRCYPLSHFLVRKVRRESVHPVTKVKQISIGLSFK